jgi:hypothetical protein
LWRPISRSTNPSSESGSDLAEGEVLVVVEGDHELLAVRQRGDRRGDPGAHTSAFPGEIFPARAAGEKSYPNVSYSK